MRAPLPPGSHSRPEMERMTMDEVRDLLDGKSDIVSFHLTWLSDVLRAIGQDHGLTWTIPCGICLTQPLRRPNDSR